MYAGWKPRASGRKPARSASGRRTRRTTEEVDHLILSCARRLFSEKGYPETSTREIAEQAGVAEVLIFRHFGSKADLYSASVVQPIADFFEDWANETLSGRVTSDEQRSIRFTSEFYKIVAENRGLIMSYLAMCVFHPDLVRGLEHNEALWHAVDRLEKNSVEEMNRMGGDSSGVNVHISCRAAWSMWFTMAMLHNLDDPRSDPPFDEEEVVDEMTRMVLYGCLNRPAPNESPSLAGVKDRQGSQGRTR